MADTFAIRGGRVIDPASGHDALADVLLKNGRVAAIGPDAAKDVSDAFDASGRIVAPGFVDIHCHLREPGYEHKETIESGTQAAARGGFTTVCAMPNTEPAMDSAATVRYVLQAAAAAGNARVLPIGAVTKGRRGEQLAELADLAEAGAIAFSDDGDPVWDAHLMRRALEYASMLGLPVIDHCEDKSLVAGGVMHESWVSARLGLRGAPAAGEESMVARDIALAEATGGHVHLAHLSTAGSIALLRAARTRGLPVTAEVTPHHLALTDECVLGDPQDEAGLAYDSNAKVNPPLRGESDREACIQALADGVIDCVATDHAPHATQDKLCEFDSAAFGISGLETALALCLSLVHESRITLPQLIERMTVAPVRALGLGRHCEGLGTLAIGAPADVTIFDPDAEWTVEPQRFASKGRNTPLGGRTLRGRVIATLYAGRLVWQA